MGQTLLNRHMYERVKTVALLPGATDKRIALAVGVNPRTILNWKKAHPDFAEDLKRWKDHSNHEVEQALFERAVGYECEEDRVVNGVLGPQVITINKRYPPDVSAAILWLKNRDPQRWSDKTELGFTDKDGNDLKWQVIVKPAKGNILYDGD